MYKPTSAYALCHQPAYFDGGFAQLLPAYRSSSLARKHEMPADCFRAGNFPPLTDFTEASFYVTQRFLS